MALGPVKFSDDFNRANNTDLGANWDAGYGAHNPFQIVSNRIRAQAVAQESMESQNVTSAQWVSVDVPTLTGAVITGVRIKVCLFAPPTETFYWMQATINTPPTTTVISRVTAGAETVLASETATTWASGNSMGFSIGSAGELNAYRNGSTTPLLTANDSTYTPNRSGLGVYIDTGGSIADVEFDNFQTGDLLGFHIPALPSRREMFC